jgi:xylulokinase
LTTLLGIDLGTTGVRCVAIDETGRVITEATDEYPLISPRSGWFEQRPADWWAATSRAISRVAGEVGREVAGIGLSGQMHGAVFLDARDEVIRPALLWNDQRTAVQSNSIADRVGPERLLEIAGNPSLTGFQAPKVLWLRDQEPDSYQRVSRLLLPKDYIRIRLAGDAATDVSDASGTLLLNLRERNWSQEILDALDIPIEWLPQVFESPQQTGSLRAAVARELGLPAGVAIGAGAGDNAAAAIGTGIIHEGLASCSIGTSGVLFSHSDDLRRDAYGRIHTFCHAVPGCYHLMGVTLAAGGSLRWWSDVIGADYERLTQLADEAPPGSEGLIFLPYLTGERSPHLDPFARGAFLGLSSRHGTAHLTRALMEGVAFSLRDCITIMSELGRAPKEIRAVGGGSRSLVWRQLLADILGYPITRTLADQGPAYGAALLAGVAAGVYMDVDQACSLISVRPDVCEPNPVTSSLYDEYYEVYRRSYAATQSTMHALSELGSSSEPSDC